MFPNLHAIWTSTNGTASQMVFIELYVPTTNTYEIVVWHNGNVWKVSV